MIDEMFLKGKFSLVWNMMGRKKDYHYEEVTELRRVLNVFDLSFLGIGSMLGMGLYIMAGSLANSVGPAMVLSFAIAGLACALSAVCYAEFAGRTPSTGSAYVYSYITVGEFVAFVIGWNLVFEFIIGTACLARGMSGYVDSLFGGQIGIYLASKFPIDVPFLASYPDFFATFLMIIFTAISCSGVKESTVTNGIFVVINICTIALLFGIGISQATLKNWSLPPSENGGNGGFLPYGLSKVMEGAATCFYAYTGFDTVATAGGEALNPQKTIPLALVISISFAVCVYTANAGIFTLMWPYTDQNLSNGHPYPYVLEELGIGWGKWLVTIGAIGAVLGCLLSSTFGMARIVFAISEDGLILKYMSHVNRRTRTPVRATIIAGTVTGIIAMIFDTDELIDMTSLGTLMAYAMVAVCVLILRYGCYRREEASNLIGWDT